MRSQVISPRRVVPVLLVLLALLLAACGNQAAGSSTPTSQHPTLQPVTTDANGQLITFPTSAPQRIISLVPSMSEILGELPLQKRIIAVDHFTNYPASLASLPKISSVDGSYNTVYNIEQIVALHPDLVLSYGNDTKQYDSQLENLHINVIDLPLGNLTLVLREILTVGKLTFTQDAATKVVAQLQQQISQIEAKIAGTSAPKIMIEIDDSVPGKPYVIGGGSFDDEVIQDAKAINVFHTNTAGQGFPEVTDEAVISADPQFIILSEDPAYGGGNVNAVYQRPNWGTIDALKLKQVARINTNLLGRPGPRLVEGLQCLAQMVHPKQFSTPLPAYCTADI